MNYVIANITDEQVKKGEKYPILSMNDGMINIDVHGTMICFNAEDKDFTVCLNECLSCDCCNGDKPIYWQNDNNCTFVDNTGNMLVTAEGKSLEFKVQYCPVCGRKFDDAKEI